MKVAVLFTGGKDSCRCVHCCIEKGYDLRYLVTIIPERKDSWMFHTPNIHLTELSAKAIGIPLITRKSSGIKEKEVEDLKRALEGLEIDAVVSGAIASNYQKTRVDRICKELELKHISPFWHTDAEKFLEDTIDLGFDIRIIGVYADGFDESWLGRKLDYKILDELIELSKKHGINLVFEGGEAETIVLDGPIFKKRIEIMKLKKIWDKKTSSGYLEIIKARLV